MKRNTLSLECVVWSTSYRFFFFSCMYSVVLFGGFLLWFTFLAHVLRLGNHEATDAEVAPD